MTAATGVIVSAKTPAELLVAWRAAERGRARADAGSANAAALHAEMRRLMDEYEWTVRGRIGRRPEGSVGPG